MNLIDTNITFFYFFLSLLSPPPPPPQRPLPAHDVGALHEHDAGVRDAAVPLLTPRPAPAPHTHRHCAGEGGGGCIDAG